MQLIDKSKKELRKIDKQVNEIMGLEEEYSKLTDEQLRGKTNELKDRLKQGKTLDDILVEAFATVREAAYRTIGLKPYKVQVQGGIMLHKGFITELKTGEGKTLVATMPLYLNALSEKGVHLVTVNDYLAKRDSEWMGKVYEYLGLTTGLVLNEMSNYQRKEAYSKDITYVTNNELGFDYLRDNMVLKYSDKTQRGFNFCIVDEVDSILIDEARTPLIISGSPNDDIGDWEVADKFVRTLTGYRVIELEKEQDINDFGEYDYIVEEKNKNVVLTDQGIEKVETYYKLRNFGDIENTEINLYVNRALKAHTLFTKDKDYVVEDDEVKIVDENTGRIMKGRRYSEGIHQALEAKEKVTIQGETTTLATISFQNLFKKYDKLSGMTGTAMTESEEFKKIYKLNTVEIPTNKPVIRKDLDDKVFLNKEYKYKEVLRIVEECQKTGQPLLIGTTSVEKSEEIAKLLKKEKVKYSLLNAKYHEKEAKIIAQAGHLGAITIATNMAGRGTDILLGGNEEYLAKQELKGLGYSNELIAEADAYSYTEDEEILAIRKKYKEIVEAKSKELEEGRKKVRELGGLYILGTERYDSRRIDNQLKGRAGRQGDPGVSQFLLSLDDDLLRIFGANNISGMLKSLGNEEDPIYNPVLSKVISKAQKKIEGIHYSMRKNLVGYDDVINVQREIIYGMRDKVLLNEDIQEMTNKFISEYIEDLGTDLFKNNEVTDLEKDQLKLELADKEPLEFKDKHTKTEYLTYLKEDIDAVLKGMEERFGKEKLNNFEKECLLYLIDLCWKEHMENMEELKKGINFRAIAQKDPVVIYQEEGFALYNYMLKYIRKDLVRILMLNSK